MLANGGGAWPATAPLSDSGFTIQAETRGTSMKANGCLRGCFVELNPVNARHRSALIAGGSASRGASAPGRISAVIHLWPLGILYKQPVTARKQPPTAVKRLANPRNAAERSSEVFTAATVCL